MDICVLYSDSGRRFLGYLLTVKAAILSILMFAVFQSMKRNCNNILRDS